MLIIISYHEKFAPETVQLMYIKNLIHPPPKQQYLPMLAQKCLCVFLSGRVSHSIAAFILHCQLATHLIFTVHDNGCQLLLWAKEVHF